MLGCKSVAVGDCLESGTPRHHQMLCQAFTAAVFTSCSFSGQFINKYKWTRLHRQPWMPTVMLQILSSSFPSPFSSLPFICVFLSHLSCFCRFCSTYLPLISIFPIMFLTFQTPCIFLNLSFGVCIKRHHLCVHCSFAVMCRNITKWI